MIIFASRANLLITFGLSIIIRREQCCVLKRARLKLRILNAEEKMVQSLYRLFSAFFCYNITRFASPVHFIISAVGALKNLELF